MADPRQALVQQMLQSKRGSPDLPGPQAIQQLQSTPTDGMIQQFLDQFGVARTQNPNGPVPGEIPMPRPRMPDMAEGPMGRYPHGEMPLGTMSTSDVQRGVMGEEESDLPRETIPDQMTDEDMLNRVSNQMGGGGEFDWEGGDGAPTASDIKYAMQDDDLKEQFIKHFGAPPEEFQDQGTGDDADTMGD